MSSQTPNAAQIRAAISLLNWENQDLAKACGVTDQSISNIKRGVTRPQPRVLAAIKNIFEYHNIEFLEGDGVRRRPEGIKVYQGREGARAFYDDVYDVAKRKGGDFFIVNPSSRDYFAEMLGDYHKVHVARMTAILDKIRVKVLLTEDKDNLPGTSYVEYRWISKHYIDTVCFYVFDDRFAIILIEPEIKITVIQSRVIADAYRRQFHSMWGRAVPLNKPPN